MIDGEKVAKIMVEAMKEQLGKQGEVLAVDGKAVRGTWKDGDLIRICKSSPRI